MKKKKIKSDNTDNQLLFNNNQNNYEISHHRNNSSNSQIKREINQRHSSSSQKKLIINNNNKNIKEFSFFVSDIDNRILCNKIDMNGCLINTCFYLVNQGEEILEMERVLKIFDTLREVLLFSVNREFLLSLSKILNAFMKDKVEYLKTRTFFINLRQALDTFEFNEEEEEKERAKFAKKKKVIKKKNMLPPL